MSQHSVGSAAHFGVKVPLLMDCRLLDSITHLHSQQLDVVSVLLTASAAASWTLGQKHPWRASRGGTVLDHSSELLIFMLYFYARSLLKG